MTGGEIRTASRKLRESDILTSGVWTISRRVPVSQALTESSDEACHVSCPVDCVVAGWSAWSHCSLTCGLGKPDDLLPALLTKMLLSRLA